MKKFAASLFACLMLICALFAFTACDGFFGNSYNGGGSSGGSSSPQLFTRSATNADITVQESQLNWSSLGQDIVFTANVDISGLTLKFSFYDGSNKLVTTKTKSIGNVVKGNQYTVTFSITDFSLSENFSIRSTSISVASGSVSYFS